MARIMTYWPEVIKAIREFRLIAAAQDPELDDLWAKIEDLSDDQYIESSTINGVRRREAMLGIVPRATETIEDRKFTILARWNEQLPYTERSLRQKLANLCGDDGYTLEIDVLDYTVKVRVELIVKNQFDAVDKLLGDIVPLNMVIDLSLRYNQHSTLAQYTHAQLSTLTHDEIRNEVITL